VNEPSGATADGPSIFEADGVVKSFGGIRAVDRATLSVGERSITALIGPNGAGKTTFFNVITGFYSADGGSATFAGREVLGRPPYAIARQGMVRTFQITKALARMPVIDNMMLGAADQPGERLVNVIFRPGAWRRREKEVRAQAMELLEVFNLAPLADPVSCCSTSRWRASTRPSAADCSTTCSGCAPRRGSRSCSSSTTWRW
jgi:neutral amino acid transport system ATP-binding protein